MLSIKDIKLDVVKGCNIYKNGSWCVNIKLASNFYNNLKYTDEVINIVNNYNNVDHVIIDGSEPFEQDHKALFSCIYGIVESGNNVTIHTNGKHFIREFKENFNKYKHKNDKCCDVSFVFNIKPIVDENFCNNLMFLSCNDIINIEISNIDDFVTATLMIYLIRSKAEFVNIYFTAVGYDDLLKNMKDNEVIQENKVMFRINKNEENK